MSVVVVATITPIEGHLQQVLDALAVTVPLVHEEPGCELYAAHSDGKTVVMVERWASREALDVHSAGDNLKKFGALAGPSLSAECHGARERSPGRFDEGHDPIAGSSRERMPLGEWMRRIAVEYLGSEPVSHRV